MRGISDLPRVLRYLYRAIGIQDRGDNVVRDNGMEVGTRKLSYVRVAMVLDSSESCNKRASGTT